MRRLIVVLLIGCGRVGFDPSVGGGDALPADAPPLPASLVCSAVRLPIPAVAANADLAVDAVSSGFSAAWADPRRHVQLMPISAALAAGTVSTLPTGPVSGIAGLMATPATTLLVTIDGTDQTLWAVNGNALVPTRTETSLAGRAPLVTDATELPRAWVRGLSTGLNTVYVTDAGVLKTDALIPTSGPVTAISGANNNDHGHITWSEDLGGGVIRCTQMDLDFISPSVPMPGGSGMVAESCYEPRIDSGPPGTDSIFTAYRTGARAVDVRFLGATVDLAGNLSSRGRAPRVRFDGTRFWVSWIDERGGGDVLRVAAVEQDLSVRTVDLPGWVAVGDEAIEMVRALDTVYLFVLGTNTLSILRTCP